MVGLGKKNINRFGYVARKPIRLDFQAMESMLKKRREELGLSQEELGVAVGTSGQQIGRLESGSRRLTVEWMRRLSVPLKCRPEQLMGAPIRYATEIQFLVDGNITKLLPEGYKTVDNLPSPVKNDIPLFITGRAETMNDAATQPRIELPADISGDNIIDLIIADNRYLPAYGPGDEVFYCADDRKGGAEATIYAGSLCVVKIDAKTAGLYRLYAGGKPGLYMLHQVSGPVLIDQAIEWAAPELGKRQRRRA